MSNTNTLLLLTRRTPHQSTNESSSLWLNLFDLDQLDFPKLNTASAIELSAPPEEGSDRVPMPSFNGFESIYRALSAQRNNDLVVQNESLVEDRIARAGSLDALSKEYQQRLGGQVYGLEDGYKALVLPLEQESNVMQYLFKDA